MLTAVLTAHSAAAASRFIDEVCWRTYWKGWLQLRPTVWQDYLQERADLLQEAPQHPGYQRAIAGRTGIDCFDAWADELVTTNYLHNHARMWYASIWIHTLKLPWQLGADWFLRHLLDGDPASNTLSWRWVAGLHTRGKPYLARADNIRQYTHHRFTVKADLATEPIALAAPPPPLPQVLAPLKLPPENARLGLLLSEEDLSATDWLAAAYPVQACAKYFPAASYAALQICAEVVDFRYRALDALNEGTLYQDATRLVSWAKQAQLDGVITPEPFTGHWPGVLQTLKSALAKENIELFTARHWWDETLFPHASKGFFSFRQAIPTALEKLSD